MARRLRIQFHGAQYHVINRGNLQHDVFATAGAKNSFIGTLDERAESSALDTAAEAAKPIHMRGRSTDKPQRAAVTVRLTVDGVTEERTYRAKGISHDGPALDEWRHPLTTGDHEIEVEILTGQKGKTQRWSGRVQAKPRHLHVVTFKPESGFRVE